jgi:hypothetical protein
MPSSVSGCGTKYYGERAYQQDGSYLTTNFFCLLYFPIIPLHTVRVIPDPKNTEWSPVGTNYYMILEKRFPNLLQVASVYLCELVVLALMVLHFAWTEPYLKAHGPEFGGSWLPFAVFLLTLVPVFVVVHLIRSGARKRSLRQQSEYDAGA